MMTRQALEIAVQLLKRVNDEAAEAVQRILDQKVEKYGTLCDEIDICLHG